MNYPGQAMIDLVQNLLDGVMLGATYALLGLGFTLIFGVMGRLNLAFGPTILVGLYAGSLVSLARPGSVLLALGATVVGTVLAGLYVERLCFDALRAHSPIVSLISTFAVWMQLQELVSLLSVSRTLPFPAIEWVGDVTVGPVFLRGESLLMWGGATALTAVLLVLLYHTRFGRAVRAVSDEPAAASLMGVNVRALGVAAFLLASAVGAAGGVLIASNLRQVTPYFGLWATSKGLTAMILGGGGSIPGAVAGGLLLGIVEVQTLFYLGGQFRDLATYALLFLVLAIRQGPR
jgi:branched-subunit amino acid ABC-type transport system permease component